jgi:anti-sigma factor RsiW
MSCEHYEEAICELVDGDIEEARRAEVEAHLATCPSCRALADDLARLRVEASRLPVQHPPAHIWTKVSARIEESGVRPSPVTRLVRLFSASFARRRLRFALGGGLSLALAAVLLLVLLPRGTVNRIVTNAPQPVGSSSPVHANDTDLVKSVESELQMAEEHYQKAIDGLQQIANAGQGSLDPQVAATLQQNLAVIDRAIQDSQEALSQQPTNELAQQSLFEAFRRKVGLLQDTISLINEMRKGDPDAAAKIIGNLNKT